MPDRAIIGVSACVKTIEGQPFHAVGEKYIVAVAQGACAIPVLLPALGDLNLDEYVTALDGILLTGSVSNIDPQCYGDFAPAVKGALDPGRDRTVLPLIHRAITAGLPILGLCRGLQELNVAFGGTLHQALHDIPGKLDHRAKGSAPEQRYGPAHPVRLATGGMLAGLSGSMEIVVSSVHEQGIDRLGEGLEIEAVAPDGVIEAIRLPNKDQFVVAVQWHPEWRFWENAVSSALFRAFGTAALKHSAARRPSQSGRCRGPRSIRCSSTG